MQKILTDMRNRISKILASNLITRWCNLMIISQHQHMYY